MAYNSDRFNLNNWKITLPVDSSGNKSGTAVEVQKLIGYENSNYFWDGADGAMVFRAMADGATTSGSKYARSELREMNGDDRAAWKLSQGGTMSATLKIDELPSRSDGSGGRMVVGQIHGKDHELIRLYYENGTVHFVNDRAGSGNKETTFTFKNAQGEQPSIGIGEKFSYSIDARGSSMTVKIFADGKEYSSVTPINSVWQSDEFYFKAGVYLGINEGNGKGHGQASFYGLDFSHASGGGMGGWKKTMASNGSNDPAGTPSGSDDDDQGGSAPVTPPTPPKPTTPTTPEKPQPPSPPQKDIELTGNAQNNVLNGGSGNEVIKGLEGDDLIKGNGGDDYLWGNAGNDTLIGGAGSDTLKGGNGADTYVVMKQGQIVNVVDFSVSNQDRVDVTDVLGTVFGFKKALAFDQGFLQVQQQGKDVAIYADLDGNAGAGQRDLIAMLNNAVAGKIGLDSFILPEDSKPGTPIPSAPAKEPLDINGNASANVLIGDNGNDTIRGQGGDDTLQGGGGRDFIWGNDGNDKITGGEGADTIKGGNGIDTYAYNDIKDAGDVIQDFRKGEKLDISGIVDKTAKMNGLTASQLIEQGFVSIEQKSATQVDVHIDVDGSAGSAHDVTLVSLSTLSDYDLDSSDFIF